MANGVIPAAGEAGTEREGGGLGRALLAFLAVGTVAAVACLATFGAGESLGLLVGVAALIAVAGAFFVVPLSVPVKIIFLVVSITFLQTFLGYFKVGQVRGLNMGNLLLGSMVLYWVVTAFKRGRWYRTTTVDGWLALFVIVYPIFSMLYAVYWRRVPGYSAGATLTWYKQWVTPFIYFFVLCQCLDSRKDIRLLFGLLFALVGIAVLESLPDTLRFGNWRESRSEGFVGQPNEYASLLASMAPFLFLVIFLLRDRPRIRLLSFLLLCGMGLCVLTTYSRAGYVGFAIALAGAAFLSYRSTGRLPVNVPVLVACGVCLLPIVAVPEFLESLQNRFEVKTYLRARRKSYSEYTKLNSYSGGRIEYWLSGLRMAEDHPIFGVGCHAFLQELPRYHPRGDSNYPHNQYVGAVAEGGVVWLAILLLTFVRFLSFSWQSWRAMLVKGDLLGQIICGGALIAFTIMAWVCMSNDFFDPGPKNIIFWVAMAGAVKYPLIPPEGAAGPPASAA